jgi:demethylmenaquinone methyltransferase/2-methoxy-6-polyprenyl-1,4-benzoquinol methylase
MKTKESFEYYSEITRFLFRLMHPFMSFVMDSPLRRKLNEPVKTLTGARVQPGHKVLEVGCGTGYFTVSAAKLVGDSGLLYAIDVYPPAIECVSKKISDAHVTNVRLINTSAMNSGLPGSSFDRILLFGVIPAPVLPLDKLLPEMHRLLKPEGTLAVWTLVPWWSPASVTGSRLFAYTDKQNGVHNFQKIVSTSTLTKYNTK